MQGASESFWKGAVVCVVSAMRGIVATRPLSVTSRNQSSTERRCRIPQLEPLRPRRSESSLAATEMVRRMPPV